MDELTDAELTELHRVIQQSCQELEELLDSSKESSQPVALDEPIGRLSRVAAMQQQQMAVASRQAQHQRLQLLSNALQSIERDSYGICRICEEPIGYKRLLVRPETPFCLACQSRSEGER